tara:strand:- start:448 stop:663 length:216 start_codon:yes stop_codon:yes gene_type:complete
MIEKKYAEVEGSTSKVRDLTTNAILTTDLKSLQAYKAGREQRKQQAEDINMLKEEMSEIKAMLQKLLNKSE